MEDGAQGMDVDLPLMEEAIEIDDGGDHIRETQDDRLSLSHVDESMVVVVKEEKEEEEEEEAEAKAEEGEGNFEAE